MPSKSFTNQSTIPTTNDVTDATTVEPATVASTPSKFVSHMKQYPLAVAAKKQLMAIPLMTPIANMVAPITIIIGCDMLDNLADGTLNQIDRFIPGLKQVEVVDVTNPIMVPINEAVGLTTTLTKATETTIHEHVTVPALKVASEIEDVYHKTLYTDNGKNRILAPMDPIVKPINNKMVEVVDHFKPNTLKPTPDQTTSEVQRSRHLLWNFVTGKKIAEVSVDTVVVEAN